MAKSKVCIIGAGPCGISLLYNLHKNSDAIDVTCFERNSNWGGLWNYTWRTGTDENGLKVHGSMYRQLWSNGPKECLELPDYTFDQHFGGKPLISFPPREVLYDYITGRQEKAGLRQCIQFEHNVETVTQCDETDKFTVTVRDLTTNEQSTDVYDYVVVAAGHFSTPNVPYFHGIETFTGQLLHVHDLRSPEHFAGHRVLVIGTSYSGEDMAMMAIKYGAKSAVVSYRTVSPEFNWPRGVTEKPLIDHFRGNTVTFKDGTTEEIDFVVYCTGYLYSFPFMPKQLTLVSRNDVYPPLYKGIVLPTCHRLIYMGMQDQYYTFTMFELQALAARQILLGKYAMPPQSDIDADVHKWVKEKDEAGKDENRHIEIQTAYCGDLVKTFGLHGFKYDVEKEFKEWEEHKHEDIATYRDRAFRSIHTGKMAAAPKTPWMQARDDSMKHCFDDCAAQK